MDALKKISMTPELKRVLKILLSMFLTGLAALALFFYLTREKEDVSKTTIVQKVKLPEEDRKAVAAQGALFVNRFGTWGLRSGKVLEGNLINARYQLLQGNSFADDLWMSRYYVYNTNQADLILRNSPLWYPPAVTDTWNDLYEQENLISFTVNNLRTEVDPYQGTRTVNGVASPVAQVVVNYDSKERKLFPTGDDAAWDGTFNVLTKRFPSQVRITFVKIDGVWKASSMDSQSNPFTLVVWREPTDYQETQFDFQSEGTMKAKK